MAYPISNELEIEGDLSEPGKVTLSNGTDAVTLQASTTLAASYDFTLPDALGAVGEHLVMTSPTVIGWGPLLPIPAKEIWILSDPRSAGVSGGNSTASVWNNRILNTIIGSPTASTDVQLAVAPAGANEILIQPGSYYFYIESIAYNAGNFKSALWNVTTGTYAILGQSSRASLTNVTSTVMGTVTFTSQTVLSVRTYMAVGTLSFGLGRSVNLASLDEIYTKVYIQKL